MPVAQATAQMFAQATRHSQGSVLCLGLSKSYEGQILTSNLDNPEVSR